MNNPSRRERLICSRKVPYETEGAAQEACAYPRYSGSVQVWLMPYRCPVCTAWHLTTKRQEPVDDSKR